MEFAFRKCRERAENQPAALESSRRGYCSGGAVNLDDRIRRVSLPLLFTAVVKNAALPIESVEYARHFAKIRTYLETCARNGINEFEALLRLTQDNPFSLSEVLSYSGS